MDAIGNVDKKRISASVQRRWKRKRLMRFLEGKVDEEISQRADGARSALSTRASTVERHGRVVESRGV
jgi:hypothetical protein